MPQRRDFLVRNGLLYLIFVMLLAVTGCSRERKAHAFYVNQSNGIPIAITEGGPKYAEPPFQLEPVLTVNQRTDVPASLLRDPRDFAPGPEGTLIVVERNEGRAVVYDSDGEFIRELGGKGAGPGEFQIIQNLNVLGDSLAFYDRSLLRLSIFRVDGTLVSVFPTRKYGRPAGIDLLPGNLLALRSNSLRFEDDFVYEASNVTVIRAAIDDTLASLTTDQVLIGQNRSPGGGPGGTMVTSILPFSSEPTAMLIPGNRVLLTTGDRPELAIFDIGGGLIRKIRLALPPRRVTQEMKIAYWQAAEQRRARLGRTLDPSVKANQVFPEKAGWWSRIIADEVGYLWLQDVTSNPGWLPDRPWRYFVIDPEGCYLGDVEMPSETGRIENGRYCAIVKNPETDESIPTVYRIVPTVEGLEYP